MMDSGGWKLKTQNSGERVSGIPNSKFIIQNSPQALCYILPTA